MKKKELDQKKFGRSIGQILLMPIPISEKLQILFESNRHIPTFSCYKKVQEVGHFHNIS